MLTLTHDAIPVIRRYMDFAGDAARAGLRIAPSEVEGKLMAEVATAPQPDDLVLESEGARVFIAGPAASMLSELELYAVVNGDNAHLALRQAS